MKGLFGALLLLVLPVADGAAATPDSFLYLPPGIMNRVVFYHSFEAGLNLPELNSIGATLAAPENGLTEGFSGRGYRAGSGRGAAKKGFLVLRSPALSFHRPMTVMFWWRLDEPMTEETGFNLVALRGKGWISAFVAGKGPWCGLTEPTHVFQCYNFGEMENWNDIWAGRAWFEPGVWRHLAVTISAAADIRIYRDGQLRTHYAPKQRLFRAGEITYAELGATGEQPAMSLDEIVVLDRALSGEELASYVTAVKGLLRVGFR